MKKTVFIIFSAVLLNAFCFAADKSVQWKDLEGDGQDFSEQPLEIEGIQTVADAVLEKSDEDSETLDAFEERLGIEDSEEYGEYSEDEEKTNPYRNRVDVPKRFIEFGMKVDVGVSNNLFKAGDFLTRHINLDLKKIADKMPYNGLHLDVFAMPDFFFNLNIPNGIHIGLGYGLEVIGNAGIGKSLFDFLGHGNSSGEPVDVNVDVYADAFAHFDLSIGMDFLKDHHLEVTPAIFIPLAHATTNSATARMYNTLDGKIVFDATANATVYTFANFENATMDSILNGLSSGWGFDIATSVGKEVIENLTVEAYSRIPIAPGKLKNRMDIDFAVSGEFDGVQALIDGMGDENSKNFSEMFTFKNPEIKHGSADFNLNRPFRIGGRARYEPLGEWLSLEGLLGLAVKSPFSEEARCYGEYSLSANVGLPIPVIGKILALEFSHGSEKEIFYNQLKFIMNFKAFELDVGIASSGSNFPSSFTVSGARAFVYMAFGW